MINPIYMCVYNLKNKEEKNRKSIYSYGYAKNEFKYFTLVVVLFFTICDGYDMDRTGGV